MTRAWCSNPNPHDGPPRGLDCGLDPHPEREALKEAPEELKSDKEVVQELNKMLDEEGLERTPADTTDSTTPALALRTKNSVDKGV